MATATDVKTVRCPNCAQPTHDDYAINWIYCPLCLGKAKVDVVLAVAYRFLPCRVSYTQSGLRMVHLPTFEAVVALRESFE